MNRHQRRVAQATRQWRSDMKAVVSEVQGAVRLTIVLPEDFLAMLADYFDGYEGNLELIAAVSEVVKRYETLLGTPSCCLCAACRAPLAAGFAVVVADSGDPRPKNRMALGICTACGTDMPSIEDAARRGLAPIWPDLHRIDVHPTAGSA